MAEQGKTQTLARRFLQTAHDVVRAEAEAVGRLHACIDEAAFIEALAVIHDCPGTVVCTGIGKAGLIAAKVSATLASTGTPSHFLHPVEAVHGDLGRIRADDIVLALSHSGETEEMVRLLGPIKRGGNRLILLTGESDSPLARHADVVLCYGKLAEACPMGLAPSASTTAMLALGDALALTVMQMRQFGPAEFALFHPAGNLGRQLLRVEEAMSVKGETLPVAQEDLSVREALRAVSGISRRPGAVLLVDERGRLTGIFSDADLRRRIEEEGAAVLDRPVRAVMTRQPRAIRVGSLASEALNIFRTHRIDELPVVDEAGCPRGILDVQDITAVDLR